MSLHLRKAIERVYAAFANVKPGTKLDYYPLWELTADEERTLLGSPLRLLPSALLGKYVQAVTAFGRPDDAWWPYFVPRVVELVAQFDWPHPYGAYAALWLLHGQNDYDEPRWRAQFDAVQVAALDNFADAFWRRLIQSPYHCITEPHYEICGKLTGDAGVRVLAEMLVDVGFPVDILLTAFDRATGELPDVWLAAFVNAIVEEDTGAVDFDVRRERVPSRTAAVCAHALAEERIGQRLTLAFFRETRPREQVVLSRGDDRLRKLRAAGKIGGARCG
jgi:hypothetical protein